MECLDSQAWVLDNMALNEGNDFKAKEVQDMTMGSPALIIYHTVQKQPSLERTGTTYSRYSSEAVLCKDRALSFRMQCVH